MYSEDQKHRISEQFHEIIGDNCYLDHASATLYGKNQIDRTANCLSHNLYSNPHTFESTSSKLTNDIVYQMRLKILSFFNTTPADYSVIFTSNATQAIKLVGESFFTKSTINGIRREADTTNCGSKTRQLFAYLKDNHTSILGLRRYSDDYIAFDNFEEWIKYNEQFVESQAISHQLPSLFAYPAQSNFCGYKYSLDFIDMIERSTKCNWCCLLDTASYVCTNPLDLSKYAPSFLCLSFYKMFGLPTGLGALLVKKTRKTCLHKWYSGGGTYLNVSETDAKFTLKHSLHESFEDGTLNYLAIIALQYGFSMLQHLNLDMSKIQEHVFFLTKYMYDKLIECRHSNGKQVACVYSKSNFVDKSKQGAILNFNLLRSDGQFVGFSTVSNLAKLYKIHLRTGCCCNPGACNFYLNLSSYNDDSNSDSNREQANNIFSYYCNDKMDLYNGKPTGSIRVSFGYMSSKSDADYFLQFIRENFIDNEIGNTNGSSDFNLTLSDRVITSSINNDIMNNGLKFSKIFVYPVKSCKGFQVDQWNINQSGGLMFDRVWAIVQEDNGTYLNQKIEPRMVFVNCRMNLEAHTLEMTFENPHETFKKNDCNTNQLQLKYISKQSLQDQESNQHLTKMLKTVNVCRLNYTVIDCGDDAANWLSKLFNRNLRLIQHFPEFGEEKSMFNQSEFLLINTATVANLQERLYYNMNANLNFNMHLNSLIERFRPNFVLESDIPFIENNIDTFSCMRSKLTFKNIGPCNRCSMICIDQHLGYNNIEFFKFLSKLQRKRVQFGIHLQLVTDNQNTNSEINTSDVMHIQLKK